MIQPVQLNFPHIHICKLLFFLYQMQVICFSVVLSWFCCYGDIARHPNVLIVSAPVKVFLLTNVAPHPDVGPIRLIPVGHRLAHTHTLVISM